MPELPEVETTVRYLRKHIKGLSIKGLWTDWPKITRHPASIKEFERRIKNKKIVDVRRRAKFIVLDISGKESIFIHQKISGHLMFGRWKLVGGKWVSQQKGPLKDDPKNRHIRLVLFLSNNKQLALADLRRFGKIMLINDSDIDQVPAVAKLGPEPLDISFLQFKQLFSKKHGVIKSVLMDPMFIAGIGNIYSDEILWLASLHPLSRVEKLSESQIKTVWQATKKILTKAIELKGSSVDDYRTPEGERGQFQNATRAYHHTGSKCSKRDGGIINRMRVGGRSAHFCSHHQKLIS